MIIRKITKLPTTLQPIKVINKIPKEKYVPNNKLKKKNIYLCKLSNIYIYIY